jgi:hypothetical protein
VNKSTFAAELPDNRMQRPRNPWLQFVPMRIELPPATWSDGALRAEDDAHTLTLATQPVTDWALPAEADATLRLRVEVTTSIPPVVTLTF